MNKNLLEWTVFGVSAAVILAVAGLLVHEQITAGERPADLSIAVGAAVQVSEGFAVPLDLRNSGDTSAEDVHVSVILRGGETEESDVTFPFVPYRSARRGWVMFSRQPGAAHLEARVLGYREP